MRPTEDMLNAYVDGELDAETAQRVAAFLAEDASARTYVEALRRVNALAPEAMEALVPEPSQVLIDKINAVAGRAPRKRPLFAKPALSAFLRPYAIAAALVLTAGLTMTYALLRSGSNGHLLATGPVARDAAIAPLLEGGRSGEAIDAAISKDGVPVHVTLASTFQDKRGRYCREIEISSTAHGAPLSASVACRAAGAWHIEGSVQYAADPATRPGIAPAGSDENDPLATLLQSLGAGRALSSAQVETVLANDWK